MSELILNAMTVLQLKKRIIQDVEKVNNEQLLTEVLLTLEKEIANEHSIEVDLDYKIADLKGKLEWQGDALEMQKEMRNEWT